MKTKKNIIVVLMILLLNVTVKSQSLNKNIFIDNYIRYEKSQKELKKERFDKVISILEQIKKNNVTNFNDDKIKMHLIYAYYRMNNFSMALKNVDEFISSYPNHRNIDYVMYMHCLINIKLDKNIFFNIFIKDKYKNDLNHAIYTFFQLKSFIKKYPHSFYIPNAKKHLLCLKYRLSEYDLQILKFYFFHKEYITVINRGQEILQKYPETQAARQALTYMEKSYHALKMFNAAKKISKIIFLNKIVN